MEPRQRLLIAGAGIAGLLIVVAAWRMSGAGTQTPSPASTVASPVAPPAHATPAPASPVTSTAIAPAAKPAAASATRQRVQQRLDAIAQAYEQGDARAIERALWPNHAVIRPDGERLDRSALLAVWAEEWEAFRNRELRFYVEDVIEEGAQATVVWTILLTADLTDASGDPHHMMINGKQQATIVGTGDAEMLEGPIEYTMFERKLDGNAWPLD